MHQRALFVLFQICYYPLVNSCLLACWGYHKVTKKLGYYIPLQKWLADYRDFVCSQTFMCLPVFCLSYKHAVVLISATFILHARMHNPSNLNIYIVRAQALQKFHRFPAIRLEKMYLELFEDR